MNNRATSVGAPVADRSCGPDIHPIALPVSPRLQADAVVRGFFFSIRTQYLDFEIRKLDFTGKLGSLSAQQGHEHDSPSNDQVDRDGSFQTLGALMRCVFDPAPGLQHPMPILDSPAHTVPTKALLSSWFRQLDLAHFDIFIWPTSAGLFDLPFSNCRQPQKPIGCSSAPFPIHPQGVSIDGCCWVLCGTTPCRRTEV